MTSGLSSPGIVKFQAPGLQETLFSLSNARVFQDFLIVAPGHIHLELLETFLPLGIGYIWTWPKVFMRSTFLSSCVLSWWGGALGTWKVDHADDRWCGVSSRTCGTLLPTSLYVYIIKCYAIVTRCHRGSGLLNAGLAYRTPQGVWVFFLLPGNKTRHLHI